jgi:Family of unknown function (DUF6261)
MKTIRPFSLKRLLDSDCYQFAENLNGKFDDADPSLDLEDILNPVQHDFVLMGESFKKSNATLLTKQVVVLDESRDRCFKLFKGHLEAFLFDDDAPQNIDAAKIVLHTVEQYGGSGIPTASFTSETALLSNLITDLEGILSARVAFLGLTDTVTALKTKNEAFKSFYELRSGELTVIANVAPMRTLRVGFTKNYRNLCSDLESAYRHSSGAKQTGIGNLIDSINTEIRLFDVKIPKKPSKTEVK